MKLSFFYLFSLVTVQLHAQVRAGGTLLVLNKAENTLSFIDPASRKTVAKIPTGEGPHEIAVSGDGKTAYVANYGHQQPGNTISVIDVVQKKETRRVDLGALLRPHGIVEKNGKVYFTSELTCTVACYDPAMEKVTWLNGTGQSIGHMLVITPDAKRVYVSNIFSNSVTAVNVGAPPTPEHIKNIAVGQKPEALDLSPDGKELWVGSNDDGTITIIETAGNTVLETIQAGQCPIRVRFTPDGKIVFVSDYKGSEFLVFDAASRKIIKRLKLDGVPVGILVAPDGKFAYVARMQANVVSILDIEKLEFIGDIEPGKGPDGLGWSSVDVKI